MNTDTPEPGQTADGPTAEAVELPQPTAAPPAMAMGIMMLAWGIVTHWSMSLGGVLMMATALWIWIRDIRSDWSEP